MALQQSEEQPRTAALDLNVLQRLVYNAWLVGRLVLDGRVPVLLKALPLLSFVYLLIPVDCFPGILDDAAVMYLLNNRLFVPLAPPHVVGEHQHRLDVLLMRLRRWLRGGSEEETESEDGD